MFWKIASLVQIIAELMSPSAVAQKPHLVDIIPKKYLTGDAHIDPSYLTLMYLIFDDTTGAPYLIGEYDLGELFVRTVTSPLSASLGKDGSPFVPFNSFPGTYGVDLNRDGSISQGETFSDPYVDGINGNETLLTPKEVAPPKVEKKAKQNKGMGL